MIADYIALSLASFKARRMRAGLTLVGIFIGVALLVTLVSIGNGLKSSIVDQFNSLGTDKVFVYPGQNMFSMFGGSSDFTKAEMELLGRVSGVKLAAGMIMKMGKVESKGEVKYIYVSGIPVDETKEILKSVHSMKIISGRDLKQGDKYKALIGIDLTADKKVFTKGIPAGAKIKIENVDFDVAGVLDRIGNPDDDSQILMPLDTENEIYGSKDTYSIIIAQVQAGADPKKVADAMKKELRKYRNLEEGDENFSVQTMDDTLASFNTILVVVEAVVIGLALISLLVGAIGIMNTMYTSVLERTRQIGVMKAIGARNIDVALIFIIESGLLGLVGGIIGIVAGFGIAKLVELGAHASGITMFSVHLQFGLVAGAMAFSLFVGIASGLVPSLQAAKLKPIDALRYE